MRHLTILALFVALAASAPTSNETSSKDDDILVINDNFFPDELKIYTAEYDIISILYPLNNLNFDEDDDDSSDDEVDSVVFFVEADLDNGVEYKGLSVKINNVTTKILPTGTSAAADTDNSKIVYFGATDGLYVYNEKENTAEKYGSITDSIIDIVRTNGTEIIYILTDKNEIFKISENGTKKDKVDIVGAKQIDLDNSNNLYYSTEDKKLYVVTEDGTKEIEGLPSDPSYIKLLRPPFIIEDGVPVIVDNKAYVIYSNGSSSYSEIDFVVKPSAFSMEATLIQYYAYNKSIYEYNILELILGEILEDLKAFFEDKQTEIQALSTRSITSFSP